MTTLDVGLGARDVLSRAPDEQAAEGQVVSVYRVAAYLRMPAGLIALTSGQAPRGPLHLRVAVLPRLEPGDRVRTDGSVLLGDGWSVDLGAPTWTGALPSGLVVTDLDLDELAARCGGRGPGLTPEGDDVLAGALLATRAARGPAAEAQLLAVARSVPTTEVAAAFLHWAARGQCIEPAHAWLTAPDPVARERAATWLRGIGASSGEALLEGMTAALTPHPLPRPAAARWPCSGETAVEPPCCDRGSAGVRRCAARSTPRG